MLLSVLHCIGQPPMTKHNPTLDVSSAKVEESHSRTRILNLEVVFDSLGVCGWALRNFWTPEILCKNLCVCTLSAGEGL